MCHRNYRQYIRFSNLLLISKSPKQSRLANATMLVVHLNAKTAFMTSHVENRPSEGHMRAAKH